MIKAKHEAEELIKNFNIDVPIEPKKICDLLSSSSLTIKYSEQEIETENICGMSIPISGAVQIVVNSKIKVPARRLFTAAHELGHVVLHIQTGKQTNLKCSNNDIWGNHENNIELEANQFASALLMPHFLIDKQIYRNDLSWKLISEISQCCATSLEATARRVINISKDMCALIIHDKNAMWTPIRSNSFPCFVPKTDFPKCLETIDYGKNSFPMRLEECDLSDWGLHLSDSQYVCYYSALHFSGYNRTMTLLLLEERDEDDEAWESPTF